MRNQPQSTLISDVRPRAHGYKRRETTFADRSSSSSQVLNVAKPLVARTTHRPSSRPETRGWLRWRNLYFAGAAIIVAAIGVFVSFRQADNPTNFAANTAAPYVQPQTNQTIVSPGMPVRLKIPTINVDAPIEYVGLTKQGDMDIPSSPDNAGWYRSGSRPGEVGSAVMDGHFGYKNRIPAIFDNLHKLRPGDSIQVEGDKGVTTTFVVRESRTYNPGDDAKDVFSSSDGKAHLNLITCQGVWNSTQKEYSKRLVVFADKKADQ